MLILPETSARDFGPCCSKRIRRSLSLAGLITVVADEERARLSFVWRHSSAGYKQRLASQDLWIQMTRPAVDLKLKSLADKLLIELTLAGRQECFSALMDRHMDYVRRSINGLIPNTSDAEDVAQEVQLKVWMKLSSFRSDSSFRTWMVRIAINESLQWRRTAKRRRHWDAEELDCLTASTESAFQAYARKEAANAVRKAIHQLPSKFRQIVVLREVGGLTIKEAAKSLNSSPQSIKTRLFRARRMLAKTLRQSETTLRPGWQADNAA
jgi:RNA polymerase sigma factor (sigma-70 family)